MRLHANGAIVTGAGSGIRKATARLFAAGVAHVVCADIGDGQNDVASEIGDAAIGIHADVSSSPDVRAMCVSQSGTPVGSTSASPTPASTAASCRSTNRTRSRSTR